MIASKIKLLFLKIVALLSIVVFFLTELSKIKKAEVVFFFPFYHTGGAEKVHLDIVKALKNANNYVIFTNKSESDNFKQTFKIHAKTFEGFEFLNRSYFVKKIFTKILIQNLNQSKKLKFIFGCNATFFYEILPFISPSIKKIDLVHAFSKPDYGIEIYSLPMVSLLDNRVVINNKTFEDFKELYAEHHLSQYSNRIKIIPNGIENIKIKFDKKKDNLFCVLYVGRWSKEKRPELFIEIAKKIKNIYPEIIFTMAGSHLQANSATIFNAGIQNKGEIKDYKTLNNLYKETNVILITSYREGFPVVIMEAMSNGVIPISTNVGGICEHIQDEYNGILINNNEDQAIIIDDFVQEIIKLYTDNIRLNKMSENAFLYAQKEFGIDKFNKSYQKILS